MIELLGGTKGFVDEYENVDLNTLKTAGTFCFTNHPSQISTNHDPESITIDYTAILNVSVDFNGRVSQILSVVGTGAGTQINECYKRVSGRGGTSWSSWVRIDNFGCNTPAELASLLGVERHEIAVGGSCEIIGDSMIVMDYNRGSGSGIILNGYGGHINVVEFGYASYSHNINTITITNTSQATIDVIAIKIR